MRPGNNELKVKFVVSEVTQPILSVGALKQAGCQVIFDEQEAYIAHGNKRLRLRVDNGLYYVMANMQRASNEHSHCIEDEYEASWVNVAVANADGSEGRNDKRQNDAEGNGCDDKENEGGDPIFLENTKKINMEVKTLLFMEDCIDSTKYPVISKQDLGFLNNFMNFINKLENCLKIISLMRHPCHPR